MGRTQVSISIRRHYQIYISVGEQRRSLFALIEFNGELVCSTDRESLQWYGIQIRNLPKYICDAARVWGRPRATEHTKECLLPRRPGC